MTTEVLAAARFTLDGDTAEQKHHVLHAEPLRVVGFRPELAAPYTLSPAEVERTILNDMSGPAPSAAKVAESPGYDGPWQKAAEDDARRRFAEREANILKHAKR